MSTQSKSVWAIDASHSEIQFKAKHLMITNVTGSFGAFDATVETQGEDFTDAVIKFSAEVNSVSTGSEQRDQHLKSADFFDAGNFPKLEFISSSFRKVEGNTYELKGNLSIKGVSNEVSFKVEFGGLMKDPWGNIKAGFTLNGSINRKDWGLNWNAALESGGLLVSEEIKLFAEVQFAKAVA